MKKFFFTQLLMLGSYFYASCQSPAYEGDWEGTLKLGVNLQLVFHINKGPGESWKATADSPDQHSFGLRCDTVFFGANGINIEMRALRASFSGKLTGDSAIVGSFVQGHSVPVVLKRALTKTARVRPQTPSRPLPYKEEVVEYKGQSTLLTYAGTVTVPTGNGPFPAALLITGSGPQTRDEEIMGHKPFEVLADALTRNGVLVLRVDDRGIGKTTGNFDSATSEDFARDASAGIDYLLQRPDVDRKKVGVIGHSEGGMIAPILASFRKDLDFVILLAAPGIPIQELMAEQNVAILRSSGISETAINAYSPMFNSLMRTLTSGSDSASAIKQARDILNAWAKTTDTALLSELDLATSVNRMQMFAKLAAVARNPWYMYFMAYDPRPYIRQLSMKVLALNGSRDIQVIPASNLAGIRAALEKSKTKNYSIKELPGLNHLFQTCTECTIFEYEKLEETFAPAALQEINDWINRNVK